MKMIIFLLLFRGCLSPEAKAPKEQELTWETVANRWRANAENWERIANDNSVTYYRFGVAAGCNALMTLQMRERTTGQYYTLQEVYALADTLGSMQGR